MALPGAKKNISMQGNNDLHEAALSGDFNRVRSVVNKNNLNEKNSRGLTALYLACLTNKAEIAHYLLELGADPNIADSGEMLVTLTHPDGKIEVRAFESGQKKFIDALSDYQKGGVKVQVSGMLGETPLHKAAFHGQTALVEALMKRGASLTKNRMGQTPLHWAAIKGFVEVGEKLLHSPQAHINEEDEESDSTPLHIAISRGHRLFVELLIRNRADLKVQNRLGFTPLDTLFNRSDWTEEDARNLILAGGNTPDEQGENSLHRQARVGNVRAVQLLEQQGVPLDSPNNRGYTALYIACFNRQVGVARHLLLKGANPNRKDHGNMMVSGKPGIHQAKAARIERHLGQLSAGIMISGDIGLAPLHRAAAPKDKRDIPENMLLIQALLDKSADKNIQDDFFGRTPLHYAAMNGQTEVWKALIAAGADPSIKDEDGHDAIYYASRDPKFAALVPQQAASAAQLIGPATYRPSQATSSVNSVETKAAAPASNLPASFKPTGKKS